MTRFLPCDASTLPPLKALGASASNRNLYRTSQPDGSILESFPCPFTADVGGVVRIEAPEFTSLCPITGQPDFAKIVVAYTPHDLCVESKSLKLYLMGFRAFGCFHEACVNRIAMDLVMLLAPKALYVRGEFTPRGGIAFWPTATFPFVPDKPNANAPQCQQELRL